MSSSYRYKLKKSGIQEIRVQAPSLEISFLRLVCFQRKPFQAGHHSGTGRKGRMRLVITQNESK